MSDRAGAVRDGNVIRYNGDYYEVVKTQHVKPGKGGAFMQMELKNLKNGTKLNERLRTEDEVEMIRYESVVVNYLYKDGDTLQFMDQETFVQYAAPATILTEDEMKILLEGMEVTIEKIDEEVIKVRLPVTFTATVTTTQPALRNQTADAKTKPAMLDNGITIQVPVFVVEGEKVIVRTEDMTYIERAKE